MSLIKVLHVEDDPDIIEITELALSMSDHIELQQCTSGAQALTLLETYLPDVFLLDMMLPGMSGAQLLGKIRENVKFKEIPAIFMTAAAQSEQADQFGGMEKTAVISKPFDPITLGDEIESRLKAMQ